MMVRKQLELAGGAAMKKASIAAMIAACCFMSVSSIPAATPPDRSAPPAAATRTAQRASVWDESDQQRFEALGRAEWGEPRFNLACEFDGQVLVDLHPERRPVTPAPQSRWHSPVTYAVDLDSERYCEVERCAETGTYPLDSVDSSWIFFNEERGHNESVSRRTGEYSNVRENLGRVTFEKGTCVRRPFSGFPPRETAD